MKKRIDKNKIVFMLIGIAVIIGLAICFIIALNNTKTAKTSSNKKNILSSMTINKGGTYTVTGENKCIVVNTTEDVELNLENATITCDNAPAINIEQAGKVNIVLKGENNLIATTTEDLDGAIYSKEDLTLSGSGSLNITSNYDGIVSKDDLVINGGIYTINANDDGIRGKDSVTITDGTFDITSVGDAIKSTNEEKSDKGYINISNGVFKIKTTNDTNNGSAKGIKAITTITIDGGEFDINTTDDAIHSNGNILINKGNFTINSGDDAIHADDMIEINNEKFDITAHEGIEATYIKINDGTININASDDGINATTKSKAYTTKVEINGGNITIKMGQGDTDGVDSNGDIEINGGVINVTGQSTFDYDGTGTINGGTVICNGEEVTTLPNQFMGGGPGGQGGPGENGPMGRR